MDDAAELQRRSNITSDSVQHAHAAELDFDALLDVANHVSRFERNPRACLLRAWAPSLGDALAVEHDEHVGTGGLDGNGW